MPTPAPISDDLLQRAARIDALQRGFTSARDEQAIAGLFLATVGAALTALKNAIDAGEDYHTLHQLLHHDIGDAAIRAELHAHFRAQAQPAGAFKVLSDVDDTFYLNWIDRRYPRHTVYPGVRALYRELDLGPAEDDRLGDLVFLTARPYDRLGITDRETHQMLHAHGVSQSTILPGDFAHLLTNHLIAEEKCKRFTEFWPLYPEYEYVFLGDSGQGDAIAGGLMRALFFHDTYVGAATVAFAQRLISRAGLGRIAREALAELRAVPFATPEQRASMVALFQRDLTALNEQLLAAERVAF